MRQRIGTHSFTYCHCVTLAIYLCFLLLLATANAEGIAEIESIFDAPLKIKTGDTATIVKAAYGEPATNYATGDYNPPIMRTWRYTYKDGSYEFTAADFMWKLKPQSLLEALKAQRIEVPQGETDIDTLNKLLCEGNLQNTFKGLVLPDKAKQLVERMPNVTKNERVKLNRLIIETALPKVCPKKEGPAMMLEFCQDRLYKIMVLRKFRGAVKGLHIGDRVEAAVNLYGKTHTVDTIGSKDTEVTIYKWSQGEKRSLSISIRLGVITQITMEDLSLAGQWLPVFK